MSESINNLLVQQIKFNEEQLKLHTENAKFGAEQRKLDAEAGELAAGHPRRAREPAWYHVVLMIGAFGVGAAMARFFF